MCVCVCVFVCVRGVLVCAHACMGVCGCVCGVRVCMRVYVCNNEVTTAHKWLRGRLNSPPWPDLLIFRPHWRHRRQWCRGGVVASPPSRHAGCWRGGEARGSERTSHRVSLSQWTQWLARTAHKASGLSHRHVYIDIDLPTRAVQSQHTTLFY